MIESIEFKNFKCLRDAKLPLSPCTILVGPNGSGKSTVLQALDALRDTSLLKWAQFLSLGAAPDSEVPISVKLNWGEPFHGVHRFFRWSGRGKVTRGSEFSHGREECDQTGIDAILAGVRVFYFDTAAIAAPATVENAPQLTCSGGNLPAVLDDLRDTEPERFHQINSKVSEWLPEYDRILFKKPKSGKKSVVLRTSLGHHEVPATLLSQGTLVALAMLTLSHLPNPPAIIGLEEVDRGIHPRLLRRLQDAIYRLAYPEGAGEDRDPVQVIATTHSPYFLDLFKDHPEEVVIASKTGLDVQFERLSEQPHIQEILGEAPLGEAWFTGVLGGVPSNT